MRFFVVVCFLGLAGCVRYVPAECPPPPEVTAPEYRRIDTLAPPSEVVRQLVDRFSVCVEYSEKLEAIVDAYRKD